MGCLCVGPWQWLSMHTFLAASKAPALVADGVLARFLLLLLPCDLGWALLLCWALEGERAAPAQRFPVEPVLQWQHHNSGFLQCCFQGLTAKGFCIKGPQAPLSVSLQSLTFLAKKGNDPAARSTGTSGFYPCHEWVMAVHGPVPDLQEGEGDVMHKHLLRLWSVGLKQSWKFYKAQGAA